MPLNTYTTVFFIVSIKFSSKSVLSFLLRISDPWFRHCLYAYSVPSHCVNQSWPNSWRVCATPGLSGLTLVCTCEWSFHVLLQLLSDNVFLQENFIAEDIHIYKEKNVKDLGVCRMWKDTIRRVFLCIISLHRFITTDSNKRPGQRTLGMFRNTRKRRNIYIYVTVKPLIQVAP